MGQGPTRRDQQNHEDEQDRAGRLPSLEEQTPGLDEAQEEKTRRDAEAYFAREGQEERGDTARQS